MWVLGPALPLGKGKEKQERTWQALTQDLAPQAETWLKPNRWMGQKENNLRTLEN